jgi:hypothetical protein
MNYPIYIPSKSRFEKNPTADYLIENRVNFFLVIEPQDEINYSKYKDYILVMPDNNRGLAYARNFCKNHAYKNNTKWHWQVDDNIESFGFRIGGKNIKTPPKKPLKEIEKWTHKYSGIGMMGMKHVLFAWAASKDVCFNKQCPSSILVKNDIPAYWNDNIVEDTDFALQVLFAGYCTVEFQKVLMFKMPTGKMKGGCEHEYVNNGRAFRQLNLVNKWKPHFELTTQYGRTKIKPSRVWKAFKQRPRPI